MINLVKVENSDTYILENNIEILSPYRDGLVLKGRDLVEYHNIEKKKLINNCMIPKLNSRNSIRNILNGNKKFMINIINQGGKYSFHFKNLENKNLFLENPEKYLPGFGGFCLWGLAYEWNKKEDCTLEDSQCHNNGLGWPWTKYIMGPPADVELGWFIYQEKLYFNFDEKYRDLAIKDIDISLDLAQKRWISYYGNSIGPLNTKSWGRPNPSYKDSLTLSSTEYQKLYNKELKYLVELVKYLK